MKKQKKPEVSIIYVLYKQIDDLMESIRSVTSSNTKLLYEIIVVDNEGKRRNHDLLKQKHPQVKYIKNKNTGYGAGNNLGAKNAKGQYLFILNPDTLIKKGVIETLVNFLSKNKDAGVAAPNLLTTNNEVFEKMGSRELTPTRAIFSHSIISKILPNNRFKKEYYMQDLSKDDLRKATAVPGSAFMIKRLVFEKAGRFDEKIFMFFEEQDLGKRIKDLGLDSYIVPKAEVVHKWKSSKRSKKLKKVFEQSRYYYFRKHFGILPGALTEFILRLSKFDLMFIMLFSLVVFTRLYDALTVNSLSGEIAHNLLDIKNYWFDQQIPLKGPPTSHPWLDFGPLYYWIYGPFLVLSGFDPRSHFVFGAIISILTVLANYLFIKKLSNAKVALISSTIIAFSPFYVGWGHTGRFFTIVLLLVYPYLYLVHRYLHKKDLSLFLPGLLMGVILNFHFTPLLLIPPTLFLAFIYKRKSFIKDSVKFFIAILTANIPLLIYDAMHGFSMLTKFVLWIPYRAAGFLGLYPKNNVDTFVIQDNIRSFYGYVSNSFIIESAYLSLIFFLFFIYAVWKITITSLKNKNKKNIWTISILFLLFGYLGIFIHGQPPEHYYMPIAFVPAFFAAKLITEIKRPYNMIFISLVIIISLINIYTQTFLFGSVYDNYDEKVSIVHKILNDTGGQSYALSRVGENDHFEGNFAHDYQYLLWWKGNEPVMVGGEMVTNATPDFEYIIVEDDTDPDGEFLTRSDSITVYKNRL